MEFGVLGMMLMAVFFSILVVEARYVDVNLNIPQECIDKDFCFTPHNETLQNIVDDVITKYKLDVTTHEKDHGQFISRTGEPPSAEMECKFDQEFRSAYYIKDKHRSYRIVVQSESKKFIQNINMEICITKGRLLGNAAHIDEGILERKYLYCDQKYIHYKYLVLTKDLQSTEFVDTWRGVPVCCTCMYSEEKTLELV